MTSLFVGGSMGGLVGFKQVYLEGEEENQQKDKTLSHRGDRA